MIHYDIEKIIETADFLGKTADSLVLKKIANLSLSGAFYITFFGHFSAGKSRLINTILDRDILPVQSRETTAVLTYIKQGQLEKTVIIYTDGSVKEYPIEYVKKIFQNAQETDAKAENVEKIDHLEVFIDNPLLTDGLILVDSPGVNTLISKHEQLAMESIAQSGKIFYVLGGPVRDVERPFIKKIDECGVSQFFVRTKCDEFNEAEEDPVITLATEKKNIEAFLNHEITFISVSNKNNNKWNHNIDTVKDELRKISLNLKTELSTAISDRLALYINDYISLLNEQLEILKNDKGKSESDINEKLANCQKKIEELEAMSEAKQNKVKEKVENAKQESYSSIKELIPVLEDNFNQGLSEIPQTADENAIVNFYNKYMSFSISKLRNVAYSPLTIIIKDFSHNDSVQNNFNFDSDPPEYKELILENSQTLELYRERLQELKTRLMDIAEEAGKISAAKQEAQNNYDSKAIEDAIKQIDEALLQIPSDITMKLKEQTEMQPSEILKKIGNVADIAMLLIPGDAIVGGIKAAADGVKIAQVLHKAGKAGEVILKAGTVIAKNASKIDGVRDVAYTLNNVLRKRNYSTANEKQLANKLIEDGANFAGNQFEKLKEVQRSDSPLDMLSVAYWLEKFGKQFDKPPVYEIDTEVEAQKAAARDQLMRQRQEICSKSMEERRKCGLIESMEKENEIAKENAADNVYLVEAEMKKRNTELIEIARKKSLAAFKESYKNYYNNALEKASEQILEETFISAENNITMYIASQCEKVRIELEEEHSRLKDLQTLRNNGQAKVDENISITQELITSLEAMHSC